MNETIDLSDYSKEELLQLSGAILKELEHRSQKDFPYMIGDCFYRAAPSSKGSGIETCRIDSLDSTVNVTMLVFDACNNAHRYTNAYSYENFVKTWKTRISYNIFDLYKENLKSINDLNRDLVNKVINLSKEYDDRGN